MMERTTPDFPITLLWNFVPHPETQPIVELHAHEGIEFGICRGGSGVLVLEDAVVPFSAGDICVIKEHQMHMSRSALGHPSEWSYFWVNASRLLAETPGGLESVNLAALGRPYGPGIFSRARHPKLCQAMQEIVSELDRQERGYKLVVRGMICAFLGLLDRACQALPAGRAAPARSGLERIAPALQHMTLHYSEPIDVDDLARRCCTSVRTFRRTFLEMFDRPPLQYLAQLRVRMASAILTETDKSISMVAYEVGFESINVFNRQFRAAFGATPSEWRRAVKVGDPVRVRQRRRRKAQPPPT